MHLDMIYIDALKNYALNKIKTTNNLEQRICSPYLHGSSVRHRKR